MFFCDPCGQRNGWPESMSQSHGPCELCGKTALCSDIPSPRLPEPAPQPTTDPEGHRT